MTQLSISALQLLSKYIVNKSNKDQQDFGNHTTKVTATAIDHTNKIIKFVPVENRTQSTTALPARRVAMLPLDTTP